ncbi:hypothetical protein BTM25_06700 [Actinomadura rubteroloni]|uniref:Heme-binding protein n=1 Tax=Actinomadura rubteroloni TaxID=1926885 RepID=A0A2P4UMK3_9ACTN|nr:heme-binding protein [Actinomadura rubteroloni]POM26276.1 hypothetical protein BTM25_06700 [Actinomadura rubteroloni]
MTTRHLVGTAAALGALVAGSLAAAPAASADADLFGHHARHHGYVASETVLSNDALARASKALVRSARRHGNQLVTMVIMDRSGVIRLVVRTVNAGPQTYESAKRKAYTAVAFGRPTSALAGNETIKQIPGTLVLPGGVPVIHRGFPIAGIGVGGAPDGRIDESIANDVLAAVRG